jgi:hypothetical protein
LKTLFTAFFSDFDLSSFSKPVWAKSFSPHHLSYAQAISTIAGSARTKGGGGGDDIVVCGSEWFDYRNNSTEFGVTDDGNDVGLGHFDVRVERFTATGRTVESAFEHAFHYFIEVKVGYC